MVGQTVECRYRISLIPGSEIIRIFNNLGIFNILMLPKHHLVIPLRISGCNHMLSKHLYCI